MASTVDPNRKRELIEAHRRGRPSRGSVAAAILLLGLLPAVGGGILLLGLSHKPRTFKLDPRVRAPLAMVRLFPLRVADGGWTTSAKDLKLFDRKTLAQYINGAAVAYLRSGFQRLVAANYSAVGPKRTATVDIYDMGTGAAALDLWQLEQARGTPPLAGIGARGYALRGAVRFFKGRYYVKLTAQSRKAAGLVGGGLVSMARSVAELIPKEARKATAADLLPKTGLVKGSRSFATRDFLGHRLLVRVHTARYRSGKKVYTLFATDLGSPAKAGKALEQLAGGLKALRRLAKGRGSAATVGLISGSTEYEGTIVAGRRGRFLVGGHDLPDTAIGARLVGAILGKAGR